MGRMGGCEESKVECMREKRPELRTGGSSRRLKEKEDQVRRKDSEIRLRKHIGKMMSPGCGKVKLKDGT